MVSARIEKSSYFNLIQSGINLASCVWVCSDPPHFMMKICWKFMKNSDSSSNILSYIWWIMIQSSHLSTNTRDTACFPQSFITSEIDTHTHNHAHFLKSSVVTLQEKYLCIGYGFLLFLIKSFLSSFSLKHSQETENDIT